MSIPVINLIIKNRECFTKHDKTSIFEIAGFAHYEIVSSNLLAFYFNPKGKHGYGDLCIRSLLRILQQKIGKNTAISEALTDAVTVTREIITEAGNRIDILLELPDYLIIIENKIYHYLANDLDDYYAYAEKMYPAKEIIGVVLSLTSIALSDKRYFNIRHAELYQEIMVNPRFISEGLQNRYGLYLSDYAEAIGHLSKETAMDSKVIELLDNNRYDIGLFYEKLSILETEIRSDVRQLKKGIIESFRNPKLHIWEYDFAEEDCFFQRALVIDVKLKELLVAIDVIRDYKQWTISIFERAGENISTPQLESLLKSKGLPWEKKEKELKRLIYKTIELQQFDAVREDISGLLKELLRGV